MTYAELLEKGPWVTTEGQVTADDLKQIVAGMRAGERPVDVVRKLGWPGLSDRRGDRAVTLLKRCRVIEFDTMLRTWRLCDGQ